jgi:PAS domain S-box-containing protein
MKTETPSPIPFVEELPLREAERGAKAVEAPIKILLIEDSPEDRMAARLMLESGEFVIAEAENGASGLALAKTFSPDCILLDYGLPDMDGLEILEALRAPGGEIPCAVVTLTGVASGAAAAKFIKDGALDYLQKQDLNEDRLRCAICGSVKRFRMMEEHRKLQMRNAQLAAVVDASDDAILRVDADRVVQTWNAGAAVMFGYDEAEAIGRKLEELILPEGSREDRLEQFRSVVKDQKILRFETRRLRKDRRDVSVEVTIAPIKDESEKTIAVSVTYRDISKQKAIEAELIAARAEAERANRAKSTFLASASHDLRQPVQSLMLLFSLVRRQTADQPEVQKCLTMMKAAIDSLQGLLTSIIDLSATEEGFLKPVIETVDLGELLQGLESEYAVRAAARKLEFRLRSRPIFVRTDPNLLGRALRNLIENALRYTAEGGILVSVRRRGDGAQIDVFDTGVGIPADKHAEIFEEFQQLHNPNRDLARGLGLGLAIVSRLAKVLGMRIEVASNPGRGSRFSLLLPSVQAAPATISELQPLVKASGGRALIIEENTIVRQSLDAMLKLWGYETFAAASSDMALELAEKEQWRLDLILADQNLEASRTGVETIREIERRAGRAFPALMLTGETAQEAIAEIMASGIAVLHKPMDAEALRRELANLRET